MVLFGRQAKNPASVLFVTGPVAPNLLSVVIGNSSLLAFIVAAWNYCQPSLGWHISFLHVSSNSCPRSMSAIAHAAL